MSLKKMLEDAKSLLNNLDTGKQFTTKYVFSKVAMAAEKHPNDIMLNTMRDVLYKKSQKQQFINQNEIAELYNRMYKFAGSHSEIRKELPEFFPQDYAKMSGSKKDASASRIDAGKMLEPLQDYRTDLNKLAQELSGVFSLAPKGPFVNYDNNLMKKAEKFTAVQLRSIGCEPRNVRAVSNNEHFILCVASYPTSDKSEVSMSIPVEFNGSNPTIPTHFVEDSELKRLSQENVLVFLKNKQYRNKFDRQNKFADLRKNDNIEIQRTELANDFSKWANLEQDLVEATTKYDKNTVKLASSVLNAELKSFGLFNPQTKVNSSYSRGIMFDVNFGTAKGKMNISIPMEISGTQPMPPVRFKVANQYYDFSKKGFDKFARDNSLNVSSKINLNSDYLETKTYNELINHMITASGRGDLKTAEDTLYTIQRKFSGQHVVNALSKYSQLLKNASINEEREELIKQAMSRGDLIRTKNSFDLYSPKYGMPLSKLDFDYKGNLVPKYRLKNKNLEESETIGINTSQIKLT